MDHGTVLGDANKKPIPKNSPVMHCQHPYYQASCAIPKWLVFRFVSLTNSLVAFLARVHNEQVFFLQ